MICRACGRSSPRTPCECLDPLDFSEADTVEANSRDVATDYAASWLARRGDSTEEDYNAVNYFGDAEPRCRRCGGRLPREIRDAELFCESCDDTKLRVGINAFLELEEGVVH